MFRFCLRAEGNTDISGKDVFERRSFDFRISQIPKTNKKSRCLRKCPCGVFVSLVWQIHTAWADRSTHYLYVGVCENLKVRMMQEQVPHVFSLYFIYIRARGEQRTKHRSHAHRPPNPRRPARAAPHQRLAGARTGLRPHQHLPHLREDVARHQRPPAPLPHPPPQFLQRTGRRSFGRKALKCSGTCDMSRVPLHRFIVSVC